MDIYVATMFSENKENNPSDAFAKFGATIIVAKISDATRTDTTIETLERHRRLRSLEFMSNRGLSK